MRYMPAGDSVLEIIDMRLDQLEAIGREGERRTAGIYAALARIEASDLAPAEKCRQIIALDAAAKEWHAGHMALLKALDVAPHELVPLVDEPRRVEGIDAPVLRCVLQRAIDPRPVEVAKG